MNSERAGTPVQSFDCGANRRGDLSRQARSALDKGVSELAGDTTLMRIRRKDAQRPSHLLGP